MSNQGTVPTAPANLPVFQLDGSSCLYEHSRNLVWIPLGQPLIPKPTTVANHAVPISKISTSLFEEVPENLHLTPSCGRNTLMSSTSVLQYRQTASSDTSTPPGQYCSVSRGRVNQLMTSSPHGLINVQRSTTIINRQDHEENVTVPDIFISKTASASKALNDSGISGASAEAQVISKQKSTWKDCRLSKKKYSAVSDGSSDITSVSESDFTIHDESSSQCSSTVESAGESVGEYCNTYGRSSSSRLNATLELSPFRVNGTFRLPEKVDDSKAKVARFLYTNNDSDVTSINQTRNDQLSGEFTLDFHNVSGLNCHYNRPRMNWNTDLKFIKEDGIIPYVSPTYMLYGSGVSSSEKELLSALRRECGHSDDRGITTDSVTLDDSPTSAASTASNPTSFNHAATCSLLESHTVSDSSIPGCQKQNRSAISTNGSHITISSTESSSHLNSGLSLSGSVIDLTKPSKTTRVNKMESEISSEHVTPTESTNHSTTSLGLGTCNSLSVISSSSVKTACTKFNSEMPTEDCSVEQQTSDVLKTPNGRKPSESMTKHEATDQLNKPNKKRKAENMTDSYENVTLAKQVSLTSCKSTHVSPLIGGDKFREHVASTPKDKVRSALNSPPVPSKARKTKHTSPDADDNARSALLSPALKNDTVRHEWKRDCSRKAGTPNSSHAKRPYHAAFTPEASDRNRIKRRLFVDDAADLPSTKDEDGDQMYVIPGLLRKLFS